MNNLNFGSIKPTNQIGAKGNKCNDCNGSK